MTRTITVAMVCVLGACTQSDPVPSKVERTIVILNPNGAPPTVKKDEITYEQHQEELRAHQQRLTTPVNGIGTRQQAIAQDPSCAGSSMWMFDNPGNTVGSPPNNHEICFYRPSNDTGLSCTPLTNYTRACEWYGSFYFCSTWGDEFVVMSYWAGQDEGWFTTWPQDLGAPSSTHFFPWDRVDYTGLSNAAYLAEDICWAPVT